MKFYEILRKSAKFRGERIFGEILLFSIVSPLRNFVQMCEISLGKFAEGGKIRSKSRKWERNFKRKSRLEIEISFTICGHYTRVTKYRMQTEDKKKQFTDGSPC